MHGREKFYLIVFFLLGISFYCHAQFPDFKFEHINEKQNLSHTTVLDIIQDKEGFLWFGTIDGLNRFDGYTCKIFKHDDNDSTSISSNYIHGLYIDTNGDLWITTRDGGLNKYNKYTEKFIAFRHNPNDPSSISSDKVSSIIQDKNDNYWITGEKGLDRYFPAGGNFQHIILNKNDNSGEEAEPLEKLYIDEKGIIWIRSINGLIKFNPDNQSFIKYLYEKGKPNSLNGNIINSIYVEDNYLWLTTDGGGLIKFDSKKQIFKMFYPSPAINGTKNKIVLGMIYPYSKDLLIIGSDSHGIILFDKTKQIFKSLKSNPENSYSISNNHISVIYNDFQSNIWIGTWGGGINKLISSSKKFIRYSNNPLDTNSISGSSVFALLKDNSKNIWIGTSSGLDKLDDKTEKIIHYSFNTKNKKIIVKNVYGAIYQDIQGNVWFASDILIKFDPKTNNFEYFKYDPLNTKTISSNNVKCITGDREENVWIGLEGSEGGICKYDIKTKKWTRYLANIKDPLLVRFIYEDKKGVFWLATTGNGLVKFDIINNKIKTYKNDPNNKFSISYNDVRYITETKDSELWLATYGGGINRFDPLTEKFYPIKEKDGLSNNFTYANLEDYNGVFWISTNYGITKFNRKEKSFKIYTLEDGLQNNEFNTGAFYKANDGEMFFGGVNGFNRFYPNKIKENNNIPPVYITSFKLLDKEIKYDSSFIFNKNIKISYFDKYFSVEFTALDYTDPSRNKYEYKLEGFDDAWINANHRRYASYTNLNPGNYVLKVRGSNNDGVWNNDGAKLNITVSPPFWLEWWFIALSITLALILIISLVRYYSTRRLREHIYSLEKERAVQTERERISRDLHDNVGSQLTNIITGVSLAETYNKSEKQKADELLISLKGELRETMTQLRETIWALKSNEMDFENFSIALKKLIENNSRYFSGLIELKIDIPETKNIIIKPLQALYLFRIIQEAITNSIKHSSAENIMVSLVYENNIICVSVVDNGNGISNKNSDMINGNGIENMKKRAEEIGGKFEIISEKDIGVKISITLKI